MSRRLITARIFGETAPRTTNWDEVPHVKVWGLDVPEHNQCIDILHHERVNGCMEAPGCDRGRSVYRLTLFCPEWKTVEEADLTTLPDEVAVKVATMLFAPHVYERIDA